MLEKMSVGSQIFIQVEGGKHQGGLKKRTNEDKGTENCERKGRLPLFSKIGISSAVGNV